MRRVLTVAALAAALTGAGAAGARDAQVALPVDALTQVQAGEKAWQDDDCAGALPLLRQATAKPDFGRLDPRLKAQAWEIVGDCEIKADHWDVALAALERATAMDEATDWAWIARFDSAASGKRWPAAVATLEAMVDRRPGALNTLNSKTLYGFQDDLKEAGQPGLRRRALAVLAGPAYDPAEPFDNGDWAREIYASLAYDAGDHAAALKAARRISDHRDLVLLSVDRRFARALGNPESRIRAGVEGEVADARQLMSERPDLLIGPLYASRDLRRLGRGEEAVAATDAAARLLVSGKARFKDADRLNRFWGERAKALRDVGRFDEAVEAMRQGIAAGEDGQAKNITETMELSLLLVDAGRAEEAAKVAATISPDDLSPYGLMVLANVKGCVYAALEDGPRLAEQVDYVLAHEADDWRSAGAVLLCAGDLEALAAHYVRRLADPEARDEGLAALSTYLPSPPERGRAKLLAERVDRVRRRPEVRAAIARAGRTPSFDIRGFDWTDF